MTYISSAALRSAPHKFGIGLTEEIHLQDRIDGDHVVILSDDGRVVCV
jgi:hypothetical protein